MRAGTRTWRILVALAALATLGLHSTALGAERPLRLIGPGDVALGGAGFRGASADGSRVWFQTDEALPGTGDTDASLDVYERAADGTLRLISTGGADLPALFSGASADGSRVWFETGEALPGAAGADASLDVYERAADGTLRLITPGAADVPADFQGATADGARIWFETSEALSGTGDADAAPDVYERAADGTLRLIGPGGIVTGEGFQGASADGARVWFATLEALPGTGDANAAYDVYERAAAGTLRLISTGAAGFSAFFLGASADGARVWFSTFEAIPGTADTDAALDIYERAADGTLRLISTGGADLEAVFKGGSADGSRVWFQTGEAVPGTGDADLAADVYERAADGTLRLLSTGGADDPAFFSGASADGGRVWFTTIEALPGTGDADLAADVYERAADGALRLITPGSLGAFFSGSSADAARIWFLTDEALAGTGDTDAAFDVYERAPDGTLRLISPGRADLSARFLGASADGARVWFETPEVLDGTGDADAAPDVYERAFAPPVSVTPPAVAGEGRPGATLTCSEGTWDAEGGLTFTRQWRRDGAAVPGATDPAYTVTEANAGRDLSCAVTARNPTGRATAASAPLRIALPPGPHAAPAGPGSTAAPPARNLPPRILGARLASAPLRPLAGGPALARRGGVVLLLRLSERVRLEIRYLRLTGGRVRVVPGSIARPLAAGPARLRLSGRIGGRALGPGVHLVRLVARDPQGLRSAPVTLRLTVLGRPR